MIQRQRDLKNAGNRAIVSPVPVDGHITSAGPERRRELIGCESFAEGAAARMATDIGIATQEVPIGLLGSDHIQGRTATDIAIATGEQRTWDNGRK
jgi:hypothetical protein